jgi:hypothetical protein
MILSSQLHDATPTPIKNMITATKAEPLPKAQELAEELFFEPVIGFRCLPAGDPRYEIGEKMDNSMDWQDDECTGKELRGACALAASIGLDQAMRILRGYHGVDAAIYIIAGDSKLRGQDPDEVIISNPHVVGIL